MLQWNELRITPDGKKLIVDVQVQEMSYYDNIYIETLALSAYSKPEDYDPTKLRGGTTLYLWRDFDAQVGPEEEYMEIGEQGQHYRHLRKCIDIDSISDNLFFITATNNDDFAEDTPCSCKETSILGIVYNKQLLYRNSINALKTMNNCTPSKELIDYILNVKVFEMAINVGDYRTAITYWNNTFKKNIHSVTSNCGCYGH